METDDRLLKQLLRTAFDQQKQQSDLYVDLVHSARSRREQFEQAAVVQSEREVNEGRETLISKLAEVSILRDIAEDEKGAAMRESEGIRRELDMIKRQLHKEHKHAEELNERLSTSEKLCEQLRDELHATTLALERMTNEMDLAKSLHTAQKVEIDKLKCLREEEKLVSALPVHPVATTLLDCLSVTHVHDWPIL